jgi:hypothetical protein
MRLITNKEPQEESNRKAIAQETRGQGRQGDKEENYMKDSNPQSPIPNSQFPITNPQSPITKNFLCIFRELSIYLFSQRGKRGVVML